MLVRSAPFAFASVDLRQVRIKNTSTSVVDDLALDHVDDIIGNVSGVVGYALQAIIYFQNGNHISQIIRNRLMKGQDFETFFFDLDLQGINIRVRFDHFPGTTPGFYLQSI